MNDFEKTFAKGSPRSSHLTKNGGMDELVRNFDPFHRNHPAPMKNSEKKLWVKPAFKKIMIFFECTCYAGAN